MTTAMNETKENFMVDDYRMCVWLTKLNYGFDCHDGGYAKDGYATRCTYCIEPPAKRGKPDIEHIYWSRLI
jgi:hypothetical protein